VFVRSRLSNLRAERSSTCRDGRELVTRDEADGEDATAWSAILRASFHIPHATPIAKRGPIDALPLLASRDLC
jgi:hypothetical protein